MMLLLVSGVECELIAMFQLHTIVEVQWRVDSTEVLELFNTSACGLPAPLLVCILCGPRKIIMWIKFIHEYM
jgi:hypothetical protein